MATQLLYCLLYAGGIVFLAGCVVRAVRYAKQPIHLRWEIYPLPQGKSGELKVMVPEILFLKALWEFNRPMWCVSYPFHLGLYLLIASGATLAGAAILPAGATGLLRPLYIGLGTVGALSALAGACGLLVRRARHVELRIYSSAADYFNLLFFAVTLVLVIAGEWTRPAGSAGPMAILKGAARFDATLAVPSVLGAGLAAGALLAAYIPMTHMAHFIAKYFTYHQIRWDERGNVAGGTIEKKMAEYLMYRPTWSARHVGANGERTWAEIATTKPTEGGGK